MTIFINKIHHFHLQTNDQLLMVMMKLVDDGLTGSVLDGTDSIAGSLAGTVIQ